MATRGGRSSAWRGGLVIVCAGALLAAADAGAALVLTPSSPSRVVALGEDRTARVTLVFTASEAIPSGTTVVVAPVELATTEGLQFQATPIQPRAAVARDQLSINVPVELTAAESTEAGRYEGIVALRAGVGTATQATLAAVVANPRTGASWWLVAAGALFVGSLGGALLKWLTESASKLQAVTNRLAQLDVVLADLAGFVPRSFESLLAEIRTRLAQRDAAGAQTRLDTISSDKLGGMLRVAHAAKRLRDEVDGQLTRIAALPGPTGDQREELRSVTAAEANEIGDVVQSSWPEPATAELALLEKGIEGFGWCLRPGFATAANLADPAVVRVITLFQQARWEEALAALKELPAARAGALGAPALVGAAAAAEDVPPPADDRPGGLDGGLDRVAVWLTRHYALVAQLIILAAVVLTGLLFLYDEAKTFATEPFEDFLRLTAYGFAAQATGVTVAQLGGKLGSVGPGLN